MFLKKLILASYFFLFFLPSLLAEEVPTFDLGKIVITKDKDAVFGAPSTVEVSLQDIENKNAQTVDEALDFIPGVRLTVGQKNEPYVMIRGFNQDDILILLDGIPIASPYYGYVDLNQIPVESIAEIKVIKGLVSPLYGANTLGGVINIVTKKPGEKPYLELNSGQADNDTHYYTLNYGVKTKKDLSIWISGSHRESDGFKLSSKFKANLNEDGDLRENSFYEKSSFSLKLGLEKYERHNLAVFFNYIDNEKGIPPHVSSNKPRYWRFTQWKRWMTALAGESKITDNFSIRGRIFYDKYDNTLKSYDDASYTTQTAGSSWTSIYDEYAIGGSTYLYFNPNDTHSLKGAINFKKDVHKEQDDTDEPWETYEIRTYSFGIEDNIILNDRLFLSAGISYDLFDQIKTYTGRKGSNVDSFNPFFLINYSLNPETLIYSSISKRTRFPVMHQLYSNTSGNPDLKEQRNINGEIGIKHDFRKVATIELSYFYNNVKDLIERASKNDPFLNISKAIFEGIEGNIHTRIGKYFFGRLSYTYLDVRNKNPAFLGRSEEELSYIPKHKADFELGYLTDFGLSFNLLGSYNGRRYYYDSNNDQHALGGYFVGNAKVSQRFLTHWEGSIYIENIFDRNYQEEEGYPQPGRSFLFSIKGIF